MVWGKFNRLSQRPSLRKIEPHVNARTQRQTDHPNMKKPKFLALIFIAALILMVTMGTRQSLGLFLSPLNTHTGLGVASISFTMAISQLVWGAAQPLFGAVADRWGPGRVIVLGAVMLASGFALTTQVTSQWGLIFTLGLLSAAGAGAGSFSILIGATAQRLPADQRSFAGGIINAGGSIGQFIFAPLNQSVMSAFGWMSAMWMMAVLALTTAPMAWWLRGSPQKHQACAVVENGLTLRQQLQIAKRDKSYWCLHAGFFTCGFHIAFLVTHMPGEVNLCGLSASVASTSLAIIGLTNIVGSLMAGALGSRVRMKMILFWMYASRAVAVLLYLAAPKEPMSFYLFAAVLGLTWLATVPPTAGLTAKLFGTRYLATLFGLTLLSHQIGGFLGAWLGGLAVVNNGDYLWMWWADAVLALGAALVNLPIREARPAALSRATS